MGNIVNSQKEDPGVKSTCRADTPLFEACMLSSCLGYPPATPASSHCQKTCVGLTSDSNLAVGVNASVNACLSLYVGPG